MTDEQGKSATKREMSPQELEVFKSILAFPQYLKKQQWTITNYALLLDGAMIAVIRNTTMTIPPLIQCVVAVAALVIAAVSIGLLVVIHLDLGKCRERIGVCIAGKSYFTCEDRESLGLKDDSNPYTRGLEFLAALIGALVGGFLLVIFVLYVP